jgi:hypothetical protein
MDWSVVRHADHKKVAKSPMALAQTKRQATSLERCALELADQ